MIFPIIKIKEKRGDKEYVHIVGTNSHDCLYIENNAIHYLNIQGMVGTRFPDESGMYFDGVENDYSYSGRPEIEFVTIEELVEIAINNIREQTESTIKVYDELAKYLEKRKDCEQKLDDCKKRTGIFGDTSGNLY